MQDQTQALLKLYGSHRGILPASLLTSHQTRTLCFSNRASLCLWGKERVLVVPMYLAEKPIDFVFVPLTLKLQTLGSAVETLTRVLNVYHPDVDDILSVCNGSYTLRLRNGDIIISFSNQPPNTVMQIQSRLPTQELIGFFSTLNWNLSTSCTECTCCTKCHINCPFHAVEKRDSVPETVSKISLELCPCQAKQKPINRLQEKPRESKRLKTSD